MPVVNNLFVYPSFTRHHILEAQVDAEHQPIKQQKAAESPNEDLHDPGLATEQPKQPLLLQAVESGPLRNSVETAGVVQPMASTVTTGTDTNVHLISPPSHSAATTHDQQLLHNLLPSNTIALLEQHFREQHQSQVASGASSTQPAFAEQLQRVLGAQHPGGLTLISLQQQDMPAPWQALVQQAQDGEHHLGGRGHLEHSGPLPALSDLSGMPSMAPSMPPNNLVATALDAVMRTGGAMHALSPSLMAGGPIMAANSLSRLGASSLALSGEGGGSRAAREAPKLGRAHLREELLISQVVEIHKLTGKALPDALRKAQDLMAGTGHLPPDTVIPPSNAVGGVVGFECGGTVCVGVHGVFLGRVWVCRVCRQAAPCAMCRVFVCILLCIH